MNPGRWPQAKIDQLVEDIERGIWKLKEIYGVDITPAQANERARNIAAGILGNYALAEPS
jgi:hypothetical protein